MSCAYPRTLEQLERSEALEQLELAALLNPLERSAAIERLERFERAAVSTVITCVVEGAPFRRWL
jgi:hypothetical protein